MIVTEGLNFINDEVFHANTWYVGLIAFSSSLAFDAADVMSSHAGWTEVTGYSESVRQEWLESAASGGRTRSTASVAFTISSSGLAIAGYFLTSSSTKSGTTGTLLQEKRFGTVQYPTVGQVFRFRVTAIGASS
jgi:hypothetical protein